MLVKLEKMTTQFNELRWWKRPFYLKYMNNKCVSILNIPCNPQKKLSWFPELGTLGSSLGLSNNNIPNSHDIFIHKKKKNPQLHQLYQRSRYQIFVIEVDIAKRAALAVLLSSQNHGWCTIFTLVQKTVLWSWQHISCERF